MTTGDWGIRAGVALVFVIIGVVCGIAVPVGLAILSGQPLVGTMESARVNPTSPPASASASGDAGPTLPVAGGTAGGSVPTPAPTPAPSAKPTAVKLGLPTQGGKYGVTTPVAALGQYITWRAILGPADAGKAFDVEVASRRGGAWTDWSKLTSRVADARGVLLFSLQQRTPAWISVRFALPTGPSKALQGRWR